MVDYSKHRQAVERLYEDRATIKRYGETELPSGETVQAFAVVYADQPCRLSQKSLASDGQTDAANTISYDTKLFISPELDVRQGDVVEVTRLGRTLAFTAGEPFLYPTHQEASLHREDKA